MSESKQYEPSVSHIRKAVKKGQVLRSQALTRVVSLLAVFIGLKILLTFSSVAPELLLKCYQLTSLSEIKIFLEELGWFVLLITAICLGCSSLFATMIEVLQVGFLFQPNLLAVDFERLNPSAGTKKLFKGWRDIPLRLLIVALLALCFWVYLDRFIITTIQDMHFAQQANMTMSTLSHFVLALLACLILYGASDYLVQRLRYFKELRMTLKQVRDEYRENEGDPHMKALRKSLHEQLLLQELVERVKKSKVIVIERA